MDIIGEVWIGWVRLRYVISGKETFLTHKGMSVKRKQWPLAGEFSEFKYSPKIRCFWRVRVLAKKAISEKNVTRLDTFARVVRHFGEFGASGHCLVKRQVFVIRVQGFQEKSQFGTFWHLLLMISLLSCFFQE
jgi:hypothetical protein